MTSSNAQEWNKEYILANDSVSKHSLLVKFGQFMRTGFNCLKARGVIRCEMDQISENFPTDPHGFGWNFGKSMYPSRNEKPKNFIVFSWTVPKLQPPKLWAFWPEHWIIAIYGIFEIAPI